MKGWIEGDRHPKSPFHDKEGGKAFSQALKAKLNPGIRIVELDSHINDAMFCDVVLKLFDQLTGGHN